MKNITGSTNILLKAMIFALLGWFALQPDAAIAKIYKYKDDQGRTHFTDDASKIPLKYRKQGTVKKFKEVVEPTSTSRFSDNGSAEGDEAGVGEGLSSKDEGLVKKAIQVFKFGVTLGDRFKNARPNFSNGQGAVDSIQSALPLKESLASELEGAKAPELQEALAFLKQSIAIDRETTSVGAGLKKRVAGIFSRLANESQQQTALIEKLEQAMKDSKRKKAAAERKKEKVEKKKAEESRNK